VNIAYYAIGSGQPFVFLPPAPMTHVELEWGIEDVRAGYERIARNNTWVRYDGRGFGLSDRDITDFSLAAQTRDLEAVIDALDLAPAVLMSTGPPSMIALAYASQHPERVVALVLWEGMAQGGGVDEDLMRIARTNFPMFRQLSASQFHVSSESATAGLQRLMDEATTQDDAIRLYEARAAWDVTDLLPHIASPTLVLHRRGDVITPAEACRRLAAALPNGTFTTLEGSTQSFTDPASLRAVAPFLRKHVAASPVGEPSTPARKVVPSASGNAVILFTDVASSTALNERMGDAAFRDASRALDQEIRTAIRDNGGIPVEGKVLGDGVMGTFTSAREAIAAAMRCSALSAASELGLHIGVHAGDVIREGDNVYGGAVNIAARICDASAPGEILVSDVVRGMARSSAGVEFEDRGEQAMKGISEPVRVYEVRLVR
jgi:class 3 adenylate cyclase/pimeloyl-ACP methyl ester carboxylesterase